MAAAETQDVADLIPPLVLRNLGDRYVSSPGFDFLLFLFGTCRVDVPVCAFFCGFARFKGALDLRLTASTSVSLSLLSTKQGRLIHHVPRSRLETESNLSHTFLSFVPSSPLDLSPPPPLTVRQPPPHPSTYEKRKTAAMDIEQIVKDLNGHGLNRPVVRGVIQLLVKDFCYSTQANQRKGGLLGLAATALAAEGVSSSGQFGNRNLCWFCDGSSSSVSWWT